MLRGIVLFVICNSGCPYPCKTCQLDEKTLTTTCSECGDAYTEATDICFREYSQSFDKSFVLLLVLLTSRKRVLISELKFLDNFWPFLA